MQSPMRQAFRNASNRLWRISSTLPWPADSLLPFRLELKTAGLHDSKEDAWSLFVSKVRRNVKLVLCLSPVGDALRVRCRQFPALLNCTSLDWFHPWPTEALESVANRFLAQLPFPQADCRGAAAQFMALAHDSAGEAFSRYQVGQYRMDRD